jgi:hypothetical protein
MIKDIIIHDLRQQLYPFDNSQRWVTQALRPLRRSSNEWGCYARGERWAGAEGGNVLATAMSG